MSPDKSFWRIYKTTCKGHIKMSLNILEGGSSGQKKIMMLVLPGCQQFNPHQFLCFNRFLMTLFTMKSRV